MPQKKNYSMFEVMNMNRHDRRRLGKINGVRIPGLIADIKPKGFVQESKKYFLRGKEISDSVFNIAQSKK